MRSTDGLDGPDAELTGAIIGAAIDVHRAIGPGLLESAYKACLQHELRLRGIGCEPEVAVRLCYKGIEIAECYRMDLLVEDRVVVELKCVDDLLPIHEAQLLTYLRLSGKQVGLLINFPTEVLKAGIRRKVLTARPPHPSLSV